MNVDGRTKPTVEAGIKKDVQDATGRLIEYEPGNGTRYVVFAVRMLMEACTTLGCQPGSFLVALVDGAALGHCMLLSSGGYLDPSYVHEKLGLRSTSDAYVLGELIAFMTGRSAPSAHTPENLAS